MSTDVILPEAAIYKIFANQQSGYTYALQTAFASFVDDWEYTPSYTWPSEITVIVHRQQS
jgi:hypothetical protein